MLYKNDVYNFVMIKEKKLVYIFENTLINFFTICSPRRVLTLRLPPVTRTERNNMTDNG